MPRHSPRVETQIEGFISDSKGSDRRMMVTNIGLGGMRLRLQGPSEIEPLFGSFYDFRVFIETQSEMGLVGQLVWAKGLDYGVRFSTMNRSDLLKIWGYILQVQSNWTRCPYCDSTIESEVEKCLVCGWSLRFEDTAYLKYWERESAIRGVSERLRELDSDALRKILHFMEEEALLNRTPVTPECTEEFVGTCEEMTKVFTLIRKVAPTDLPVLILGESGTGKELTARAIHEKSPRKDNPIITVNCAAIPESLLEAELFGYAKGAFTGAYKAKSGKFESAHGGTLFLDEIGELPLSLQPKLLRFLENHVIDLIGGKSKTVDVRIISATNQDLEKNLSNGRFRPDLYHRINVFNIQLPPLRERGEDTVVLAKYFFSKIKLERKWKCRGFSSEAQEAIREYTWPGNIREMINRIRKAMVIQDEYIGPQDLGIDVTSLKKPLKLREAHNRFKKEIIERVLRQNQFNISRTARILGISRPYLYQLIDRFEITVNRKKKTQESDKVKKILT